MPMLSHNFLSANGVTMFRVVFVLFLSFFMLACDTDDKPESIEKSAPRATIVKLSHVNHVPEQNKYSFPAVVSAVKTIDVSFEVSGRLVSTDLITAKHVKKGHLLAAIDSAPYERRVKEQRARANKAKRELARITTLFERDLAAQSLLDNATTAVEIAEIDLNNAEQDLSYTKLYAPFDAQISERLVENNSYVKAGTSIARLQDVSKIYFTFNVPERLITSYKGNKIQSSFATLVNRKSQKYPITYVEHSTAADPVTQTYKVVFATDPVAQRILTPGARAVVNIIFESNMYDDGVLIPFSALIGDSKQGFSVYKYNQKDSTVTKVAVQVIKVVDNFAVIEGALKTHDKVVSAGVSHMFDGLLVSEYKGEK